MALINLKKLRELAKNSIPVLGMSLTFVGIAFFYGKMLSPSAPEEIRNLIFVSNSYMP